MFQKDKLAEVIGEPDLRFLKKEDRLATILLGAADLILTEGHAKMALRDAAGGHCAAGAICKVATGKAHILNDDACFAISALTAHLGGAFIPAWNNAPERTANEVIDALTAAALKRAQAALERLS